MRLLKSFGYALSGIAGAVETETNFRIHTVAAVSVIWFARVYGVDARGAAVIAAMISLVIAGELFNTAVEALTDMVSPEKNSIAKTVKDSAAGAVLIAAVGSVVAACFLFSDAEKLRDVFEYVTEHGLNLILYIAVCAVYIFLPRHFVKKERKDKR